MVVKAKRPAKHTDRDADRIGFPTVNVPDGARVVFNYLKNGGQSYVTGVFNYDAESGKWTGEQWFWNEEKQISEREKIDDKLVETTPGLTWDNYIDKGKTIKAGGEAKVYYQPTKTTSQTAVKKKQVVKTNTVQNNKHVHAAKKLSKKEEEAKEARKKVHDTSSDISNVKTTAEVMVEGMKVVEKQPIKYGSSGRFTPKVGPKGTVSKFAKGIGPGGAVVSGVLSWRIIDHILNP